MVAVSVGVCVTVGVGVSVGVCVTVGVPVGVGSVGGNRVGVEVGDGLFSIPGTNQKACAIAGLPPLTSTVRMKRTFFPACSLRSRSILVTSPS